MKSVNSFKKLVFEGAASKKLEITDLVLDRLNYEISVIEKLGLTEYFTIYAKIAGISNKEGILRSYGRGSACGSFVNYCLDITKINPLEEGLIFERFLNPEFSKWADIDIDVPVEAQKIIVEKLKTELPDYTINYIANHPKIQPNNYQKLIINGQEYSKHPCAVIISQEPLPFPISNLGDDSYYVCEDYFNNRAIFEPYKFDILELDDLNKLDLIWKQIGEAYHPYKLNLNDKETYRLYTSGDLSGIFQLDSSFCKKRMPELSPNNIHDLTIFNAMFRPGPLDYISQLIYNKKFGADKSFESDPRVVEILKETYGLLIYQEQFMQLAHELAGFSYSDADLYRRVLFLKEDKSKVEEFKVEFENGCRINSNLNGKDFYLLLDTILQYLPICFNKSHSMCYAIIGYWEAYYKANFKALFENVFFS